MRDPLREALVRYRSGEPMLPDAAFLLRWGLGFVFLWLGIDKFRNPGYWPMWIPEYLPALRTPEAIAAFGVFEVAVGLALVANVRVREVSAVASAFLAGIIVTNGLTAVARDVALLAAALYLALTTPGPAAERAAASAARPRRAGFAPGRRSLAAAVVGILVLVGVAAAAMEFARSPAPESAGGPPLVFEAPEQGAQVPPGDLHVTVRVATNPGGPLTNHVHFKVDGRVADAVYLRGGATTASTVLRGLEPGTHEIEAYLAYSDHVEYPGSRASVTITVTA